MSLYLIESMRYFLVLICLLDKNFTTAYDIKGHKVVCYFPSWTGSRGDRSYGVQQIDFTLCTHIIVAFAEIDKTGAKIIDSPPLEGIYRDLLSKRDVLHPNMKVLAAVGGHGERSRVFVKIVATPASRQTFAFNAIKYLRKQGLDGLDLDWEFPTKDGSKPEDRGRFTEFIKKLREGIETEAQISRKPKLLISAAVAASEGVIINGYDIPEMSNNLDFINLMTYDFHGSWNKFTGLNSGIYPTPGDSEFLAKLNQDWVVKQYITRGAPADKLILGIPAYGRTWSFSSSDTVRDGVGFPANGGPGMARAYTQAAGVAAFHEICSEKDWNLRYDTDRKGNYGFSFDEWVCYDGVRAVEDKAYYILNKKLGGAMVWDISMDDFGDFCGYGKYPLLMKINEILAMGQERTTESTDTTPTQPDTSDDSRLKGKEGNETTKDAQTTTTTVAAADVEERRQVPFYLNPWGLSIILMAIICVGIGIAVGIVIPRLNKCRR